MTSANESPVLLPHHKQTPLCTTRLPYRQGRNLKAVKVSKVSNNFLSGVFAESRSPSTGDGDRRERLRLLAPSIDEPGASLMIRMSSEVTSGCTVQRASLLSIAVSPDVSSEGVPTGVSEEGAAEGEANWPITAWRREAI
ncbi:hypothetical protein ACJJTC_013467 [Scirpophaga incertulas]